jgi:hypothetical protein
MLLQYEAINPNSKDFVVNVSTGLDVAKIHLK